MEKKEKRLDPGRTGGDFARIPNGDF